MSRAQSSIDNWLDSTPSEERLQQDEGFPEIDWDELTPAVRRVGYTRGVLSRHPDSPYKPQHAADVDAPPIDHPHPKECCQHCGERLTAQYRRVNSDREYGLTWACPHCTSTSYLPWGATIVGFDPAEAERRVRQ